MIIEMPILLQGRFQVASGDERGAFQHLGDATVEAFDHPIGLRMLGLDQSVLDAVHGAGLIEAVLAGGLALTGGAKAVGELFSIVGQHGANAKRGLGPKALQKASGGGGGLVGLDLEIDPAAGAINGGDQIAMFGLVGHSRQVLHIHMHEPRRVGLEGLGQ